MNNLEKDVVVYSVPTRHFDIFGQRTMLSNSTYLEGRNCAAYFILHPKVNIDVYDEWKAKITEAGTICKGIMVTYGPRAPRRIPEYEENCPNVWVVELSESNIQRYVEFFNVLLPSLEGIAGLEQILVK